MKVLYSVHYLQDYGDYSTLIIPQYYRMYKNKGNDLYYR